MRPQVTISLLAAAVATTFAAIPVSAQLAGLTTLEPEIVDYGAEPRQQLRYRFAEGQTETMGMAMTMDMANVMAGTPMVDMAIAVSSEFDLAVTEVYEDGSARVEQVSTRYEFGETGDPLADAELEALAAQFEGLTTWQVVTDRGTIVELDMDLTDKLSPEIAQQLRDTVVGIQPLPEEPVGVGARWVAAGSMVSQGVPLEMRVETEVLELSADGVTLDVAILGDADMAAAMLGELPAGYDVSVDDFEMSGSGTVKVSFDQLVPTSEASLDLGMAMTISGTEAGEPVSIGMDFDMLMSMLVKPLE